MPFVVHQLSQYDRPDCGLILTQMLRRRAAFYKRCPKPETPIATILKSPQFFLLIPIAPLLYSARLHN